MLLGPCTGTLRVCDFSSQSLACTLERWLTPNTQSVSSSTMNAIVLFGEKYRVMDMVLWLLSNAASNVIHIWKVRTQQQLLVVNNGDIIWK
jgi:hypothetical protein